MQHAYNPQNDIDTGQSIKCTAFARKTWPKKNGVSGFSYMVRRYPVKAVKTGNWCLTVCQGVQTLSTDMFACDRHTPKYLLGKNLLPEKYLGSKYLSRSRFLRNIPRVIFGREIFPENIPRKTLLAVPKNWKHA